MTSAQKYQSGLATVDLDHERLYELGSRLTNYCPHGVSPCVGCEKRSQCDPAISELCVELLSFMADHFRHEESMMDILPEDFAESHKLEHAEISRRLAELVERGQGKSPPINPGELNQFVSDWLHSHLRDWDRSLIDMLAAAGSRA
jgi:hemerythrin-like metal-binding protein